MVHVGDAMPKSQKIESAIGVTAFKSQCLGLIDEVAQGKTGRIVLLKHNRPIAAIISLQDKTDPDLWGAMRGTVTVAAGVDLTEPSGESWDADR